MNRIHLVARCLSWVVAVGFTLVPASLSARGEAAETSAALKLPSDVWAGEVFPVSFELRVPAAKFQSVSSALSWTSDPILVEPWSAAESKQQGGEMLVTTHSRAVAPAAGEIAVPAARQEITLIVGSTRFGNYVRPDLQEAAAVSAPATLHVKSLPPVPGGVGAFIGAVGKFTLTGKVVPEAVDAGRPVTWTLELAGTGNWPAISGLPVPAAPAGVRELPARTEKKPKGSSMFEATLVQERVLIPSRPGRLSLGAVRFCYFDSQQGKYIALEFQSPTIAVHGTAQEAEAQGAWKLQGPEATAVAAVPTSPPPLPARILGDPSAIPAHSQVPWDASLVRLQTILPLVIALVIWIALVARRALDRDPQRPRRDARRRALRLLDQIEHAPSPTRLPDLVWQWERAVVRARDFPQAMPRPESFGRDTPWYILWQEANAAIFTAAPSLPADWAGRARAETKALRVPRFSVGSLFNPAHFLLLCAAIALLLPVGARAAEAPELYRAGDFVGAEQAARAAVQRDPLDPAARHNLALALAQQGRWMEASGPAVAAFVQNPRDKSIRWDVEVIAGQVHLGTPEISRLLRHDLLGWWCTQASPRGWQLLLIAGAWLAAVGFCLWVRERFLSRRSNTRLFAVAAFVLGLLLAIGSAVALNVAGNLVPGNAALVWRNSTLRSVPTEAGDRSGVSPLAAGNLVRTDELFLTWRHIVLPNGQAGWVRDEDLASLWK